MSKQAPTRGTLFVAWGAVRGARLRGHGAALPWLSVAAGAVLVAFVVLPSIARAECAADYEGPRRATLDHDGAPGVWFAAPVARCMLADLEELPALRERVSLLTERLDLRDDQIVRLRRIVELAEAGEARAVEALDRAVVEAREARESASVWWRSPVLWVAVGVVMTAGLVALTAWALSSISSIE